MGYQRFFIKSSFLVLILTTGCVEIIQEGPVKSDGFEKFSGSVAFIVNQIIPSAHAYDPAICRSQKSVGATDYVEGYLLYTNGTEELVCDADIVAGSYELDIKKDSIPNSAVFKIKAVYQSGTRTQVVRKNDFSDVTKFDLNPVVSVEAAAMIGSIKRTGTIPANRDDFSDAHLVFEEVLGTGIASVSNSYLTAIQELAMDPSLTNIFKDNVEKVKNVEAMEKIFIAQVEEKLGNATTQLFNPNIKVPQDLLNQVSIGIAAWSDLAAITSVGGMFSHYNALEVTHGLVHDRCFYLGGSFERIKVNGKPATVTPLSPLYDAFMGFRMSDATITNSQVLKETIVSQSPYDAVAGLAPGFHGDPTDLNATTINSLLPPRYFEHNLAKNIAKFCVDDAGVVSFDPTFTNNLKGGIQGSVTGMSLSNTYPKHLIINTNSNSANSISMLRYSESLSPGIVADQLFTRYVNEIGLTNLNLNSKVVVGNQLKIALDGSDPAP